MSKVFVKYGFVFDPSDTWAKLSDFEQDLAAAFKQRGLKAELIDTLDNQEGIIIIYISKCDEMEPVEEEESREKEINGKSVRSS